MTSEVAVMNKLGVALAADSANTIGGGRKISLTANKIFSLSRCHPVGIMVYNNAEFMGVPWETIIKVYRHQQAAKSFPTIERYIESFREFLLNESSLRNTEAQTRFAKTVVRVLKTEIWDEVSDHVEKIIKETAKPTGLPPNEQTVGEIATKETQRILKEWLEEYRGAPDVEGLTVESVKAFVGHGPGSVKESIEQAFHPSFPFKVEFEELAILRLTKFPTDGLGPMGSGIVIAGFGDEDVYPDLREIVTEGIIANCLKYRVEDSVTISAENPGVVVPFAQAEQYLGSVLSGVDPEYEQSVSEFVKVRFEEMPSKVAECVKACAPDLPVATVEQIKEAMATQMATQAQGFVDGMSTFQTRNYHFPMLYAVASLSLPELAATAEAMVNLTSLRKKLSSDQETVGGPTDVAIVSKCDGFIWLKRKHYFEQSLNPQFMARYNDIYRNPQSPQ